jgi:cell division protein FtsQ
VSGFETTQRFLRPDDLGRLRRNQRRIQLMRLGVVARNVAMGISLGVAALWAYRQTQSDARFAVKTIEVAGARHTPRAALDAITRQYAGMNLFRIDIARVQHDLGALAWIDRIAIEKKLPDTLRINVVERKPVALVVRDGALRYVDAAGVEFAGLSPEVGDDDLPVIASDPGAELLRSVQFIETLRMKDRAIYERVSQVIPVAPRGFALFDRALATTVYANADDVSAKWRSFDAIAAAENLGRASIEYADLRFAGRVVVKPKHAIPAVTVPDGGGNVEITN